MQKKVIKRESTRTAPCSKYENETCQNIEDNKLVLNKLHCRMPILYHGHHLDHLFTEETSICNNSMTGKALDLIMDKRSECTQSQTCEKREYAGIHKVQQTFLENKTMVYVTFETPQVEYRNTYVSYDLLSLIGEVGGILGLTLGVSGVTLFDSFLNYLPFY